MAYNPVSARRLPPDDPFFRKDMGKGLANPEASQSHGPYQTHGSDHAGGDALKMAGESSGRQVQHTNRPSQITEHALYSATGRYALEPCPALYARQLSQVPSHLYRS